MKLLTALSLISLLVGCKPGPGHGPGSGSAPGSGPRPVPNEILCDSSSPLTEVPKFSASPLGGVPGATPFQTAYHATFPSGRLDCGYMDRIHSTPQPMKPGDGKVAGATVTDSPITTGGRLLGLTPPNPIPDDKTPSAAISSTDLPFGPGTVFTARATFRNPIGPHLAPAADHTNAWALSISARDGNEADLATDNRLAVTFKVKNQTATLNIVDTGYSGPPRSKSVDPAIYASIFGTSGASPKPFTIELYVNRQTGKGSASLAGPAVEAAGAGSVDLPFDIYAFPPTSGPIIKALGPTIANCCAWGQAVNVEITDFEIRTPVRSGSLPRGDRPIPKRPPFHESGGPHGDSGGH
jgi:hypothetical protein